MTTTDNDWRFGEVQERALENVLAACLQWYGKFICRNVVQKQGITEKDKGKLRNRRNWSEWVCVWMSEWTSRWKYRPSHWIFYFLQYERWDSPLCSLLLSLFQVLKSTRWKIFFVFQVYIVSSVIVIIVKNCIILNERDTKLHDSYCQLFIFYITALNHWV